MTLHEFDRSMYAHLLCGVDEAGRGPLAGDVYAAAVILPQEYDLEGLNDSKKLTPKKRDLLFDAIRTQAVSYSIAKATVEEIETLNILNAAMLAMRRAVAGLSVTPQLVLVDGNRDPGLELPTRLIVSGDATSASIAAASILAKVARDRSMEELAKQYPQYQFEKHKGYGTALHYAMLDQYGESPVHRHSFLKKYYQAKLHPELVKKPLGVQGEEFAADWLEGQGYAILARQYRTPLGEVDIIAQTQEVLCFVEVKTRSKRREEPARAAVGAAKQKKVGLAALDYLQQHPTDLPVRFDVAEVYGKAGQFTMNYLEDAFVPSVVQDL